MGLVSASRGSEEKRRFKNPSEEYKKNQRGKGKGTLINRKQKEVKLAAEKGVKTRRKGPEWGWNMDLI